MYDKISILDFGSQYTQLIVRKVRQLGVYAEVFPFHTKIDKVKTFNPSGIILSGGPSSVYLKKSPGIAKKIFELNVPVLGICYGMHIIAISFEGTIKKNVSSEYGKTELEVVKADKLLKGCSKKFDVWMSHSDAVFKLPKGGFKILAHTNSTKVAAFGNSKLKIYGVQFHPEVAHTRYGERILKNFLYDVVKVKNKWRLKNFLEENIDHIREKVKPKEKVLIAVSGGVDSTVTSLILQRAIKRGIVCVMIDNGVLRNNEIKYVRELFRSLGIKLNVVNRSDLFLSRLKGVIDPEKKRKIIGRTFIEVFEEFAKKQKGVKYLAQGTLYPDVIESVSVVGPSSHIKSHHNVGGLPEKMHLELIEPLKYLFKDEVRELARLLGLTKDFSNRHPFPGPGLSVRILGEVSRPCLRMLRHADDIFIEELKKQKLYNKIWQAFCVLLPIKTVGIMGDRGTYKRVIALRAIQSRDGMTANWYRFEPKFLAYMSNRIVNEVEGVNRVVYDITNKPPATIEWE